MGRSRRGAARCNKVNSTDISVYGIDKAVDEGNAVFATQSRCEAFIADLATPVTPAENVIPDSIMTDSEEASAEDALLGAEKENTETVETTETTIGEEEPAQETSTSVEDEPEDSSPES